MPIKSGYFHCVPATILSILKLGNLLPFLHCNRSSKYMLVLCSAVREISETSLIKLTLLYIKLLSELYIMD